MCSQIHVSLLELRPGKICRLCGKAKGQSHSNFPTEPRISQPSPASWETLESCDLSVHLGVKIPISLLQKSLNSTTTGNMTFRWILITYGETPQGGGLLRGHLLQGLLAQGKASSRGQLPERMPLGADSLWLHLLNSTAENKTDPGKRDLEACWDSGGWGFAEREAVFHQGNHWGQTS